ncbi:hypothetical protein DER45DRAFT_274175 [Fusarium avenaceum]|nr:hypothetical protein DER45DRAFT_274175 [Fusarium avenaceum]
MTGERKAAGRACLWLLSGCLLRRPAYGRIPLPRLCCKFTLSGRVQNIPRLLLDLGLFDVSSLSLQGRGIACLRVVPFFCCQSILFNINIDASSSPKAIFLLSLLIHPSFA